MSKLGLNKSHDRRILMPGWQEAAGLETPWHPAAWGPVVANDVDKASDIIIKNWSMGAQMPQRFALGSQYSDAWSEKPDLRLGEKVTIRRAALLAAIKYPTVRSCAEKSKRRADNDKCAQIESGEKDYDGQPKSIADHHVAQAAHNQHFFRSEQGHGPHRFCAAQ